MPGPVIATRVTNDPVSGNNGLFYIYSDHLGSASLLVNGSNNPVAGRRTWYLPLRQAQCRLFGGYRPGSAPTQTITDRDFTGQRENMELGLLYYNARYYAPTLGRFISADTLVPDPTNPQSYSRYSYVGNRPLSFTDPTGHAETPYDLGGGGGFGPIDDRHSSPERELGMMFIRIGLYVAATAAVKEAVDNVLGQAEGVINSTPELGNRDYFPAPLDWPTNDNNGDNRVVWRLMSFGTGLEQFNGRPKPNDWDGLSGTYADQWASPMEWFEQTVGKERPWQPGQDAIYATTVGELNAVGFDVRSTPNNIDPGHVSLGGVTPGIVNRGANASWPGNKTERAAYETLFLSAFKPNFQ